MREKDHVLQLDQRLRHARFILENVKASSQDHAIAQRLDQRLLVDDAAARHVDQNAVRPEGLQNGCVDEVSRFRTAGRDGDQYVARFRHLHESGIIVVADVRLAVAAVIGNFDVKPLKSSRDGLADSTKADDPTRRFRNVGESGKGADSH